MTVVLMALAAMVMVPGTLAAQVEAPDVLINELDADTTGSDTLEFVELYDGGIGGTSLDGMVLVFYNGSTDNSYRAIDLDGYSTDENGYFVLGNSSVVPSPAIVFPDNALQNGADAVALYAGDGEDFPNGSEVTTANLIDALVYDTNDADDPGLLVLLNAGQSQMNEDGSADKDAHSNQRCPDGSGGARNTSGYLQAEPTPGSANACPVPEPTPSPTPTGTPESSPTPTPTPSPTPTPTPTATPGETPEPTPEPTDSGSAIPGVTGWGIAVMIALLGLGAVWLLRRRAVAS